MRVKGTLTLTFWFENVASEKQVEDLLQGIVDDTIHNGSIGRVPSAIFEIWDQTIRTQELKEVDDGAIEDDANTGT